MAADRQSGWTRRDLAKAGGLLALALGMPAASALARNAGKARLPDPRHRALLREVSQLVIPRTGTAGAGELGVGDFVALALAHGLEDTRKALAADAPPALQVHRRADGTLDHSGWLESELNRRTGGNFLGKAPDKRKAALRALDAEAFAPDVREHPWRRLKALVLTGYYTTEVGGSKELRFELVPGRWDADLPATPQTIAWSSDWTAVDFG